jgi:hypothetical protein
MNKIIKSQPAFRSNLLELYGNICLICNHTNVEAAHIVDKALIEDGAYSKFCPYNGIPLCPNHHTEFDRRVINFNLWNINDYLESNEEYAEINVFRNNIFVKTIKLHRNSYIFLLWRKMQDDVKNSSAILNIIQNIRNIQYEYLFDQDGDAIMIY